MDRLIDDVEKQSGKIAALEKAVDRFKWTAAVVVFIGVAVWALFGDMIKDKARLAIVGPAAVTSKQ